MRAPGATGEQCKVRTRCIKTRAVQMTSCAELVEGRSRASARQPSVVRPPVWEGCPRPLLPASQQTRET